MKTTRMHAIMPFNWSQIFHLCNVSLVREKMPIYLEAFYLPALKVPYFFTRKYKYIVINSSSLALSFTFLKSSSNCSCIIHIHNNGVESGMYLSIMWDKLVGTKLINETLKMHITHWYLISLQNLHVFITAWPSPLFHF